MDWAGRGDRGRSGLAVRTGLVFRSIGQGTGTIIRQKTVWVPQFTHGKCGGARLRIVSPSEKSRFAFVPLTVFFVQLRKTEGSLDSLRRGVAG